MTPSIDRSRLIQILDALQYVSVGVVGDFTLDAYWYADMTRSQLSRETPLFPRPVVRETYSPGGAANVAWNLAGLGVKSNLAFTVFGQDWRGELLKGLLVDLKVNLTASQTIPGWSTPFYGKVILTNQALSQEDARLDFVNTRPVSETTQQVISQALEARSQTLDALIVADYQPTGLFTSAFRTALNDFARNHPQVFCVADSRQDIGSYLAMALKPNALEASRWLFPAQDLAQVSLSRLTEAAAECQKQTGRPFFLTQGERGCQVFANGKSWQLPAVQLAPPIDPVGAGDTFVACLASCLAAGAEPWEAASIANLASAVTVKILHVTGTASPQAILDLYDR